MDNDHDHDDHDDHDDRTAPDPIPTDDPPIELLTIPAKKVCSFYEGDDKVDEDDPFDR